jgi:hypothetical protein
MPLATAIVGMGLAMWVLRLRRRVVVVALPSLGRWLVVVRSLGSGPRAEPAREKHRTSKDVRGRVDELADGTGRSVDAVTGRQSVHIGNPGQKRRKP